MRKIIKESVRESIIDLICEARKAYEKGKQERSKRYIKLAFELIKKNRIFPDEVKNDFCRRCFLVWIPNKTVKIVYDEQNHFLRAICECGYSRVLG